MSVTVAEATRRRSNQVRVQGTSALVPEHVAEQAVAPSGRSGGARRGRRHLMLVPGGAGAPPRPSLPRFSDVVSRPGVPTPRRAEGARPGAPGSGQWHVTARGRAALTVLATAIAMGVATIAFSALVLSAGPLAGASATGSVDPVPVLSVQLIAGPGSDRVTTVRPGQTLWEIATNVAPHRNAGDVVAEIQAANGLTSAALQPGQVLIIP